MEERPYRARDWAVLALITGIAALLRLQDLGTWSFWVDEAHTWRDVVSAREEFDRSHVSSYPLSYLMLRGLAPAFPSLSEYWMRLPFAVIGILTVPALALFGRAMVGVPAALWAALLLAIDPWHLFWSQSARGYGLMLILATFGMLGLFHGLRFRRLPLLLIGFGCLLLAGLAHPGGYLAMFSVFVFSGLVVFAGGTPPGRQVWWVVGLVLVAGAVLIPFTWPSLQRHLAVKPDASFVHYAQTVGYYLRPATLVVGITGVVGLLASYRRRGLYLGTWALAPLIALSVGAFMTQLTARYGIVCLPALLLGCGLCIETLRRTLPRGILRWMLPVLMVMLAGTRDYLYFAQAHGERPRWAEAMVVIPDRPATVLTTNQPTLRYYSEGANTGESLPFDLVSLEDWAIAERGGGARYMESLSAQAQRRGRPLWAVFTLPEWRQKDGDGSALGWLRAHGQEVATFPGTAGPRNTTVFVYRVR